MAVTSACTPEEIGPTGEHLGNFPQAFTHLALIDAAITSTTRWTSQSRHRRRSPLSAPAVLDRFRRGKQSVAIGHRADFTAATPRDPIRPST